MFSTKKAKAELTDVFVRKIDAQFAFHMQIICNELKNIENRLQVRDWRWDAIREELSGLFKAVNKLQEPKPIAPNPIIDSLKEQFKKLEYATETATPSELVGITRSMIDLSGVIRTFEKEDKHGK